MGSLNFECPLPAALSDISDPNCPQKFGQIQKLAIRLKQDPAAVDPTFEVMADIIDKTKWTAAMAALDRKKIVITTFISSFVIPPGTPVTEEGNNNNTVNGMTILSGIQNVMVTGRFLNLPANIAEELRKLMPYSALTPGFTDLEAAFFNESNSIIHTSDGAVAPVPEFFPIFNFFISSVGSEGLNKPNVHAMQFEMLGDWDKNLVVSNPLKAATPWKPLAL